jgi:multimeric flavodoxin WrbA
MASCVLLDGHPSGKDQEYNQYLDQLQIALGEKGVELQTFILREMDIHYCTGCWVCWWTTPGRCSLKDEMERILQAVMDADQVLYVSPLIAGYVSANTKKVMDRMIPLVHPYIEVVDGEAHHRKRYAHYPNLALILAPTDEDDKEDVAIASEQIHRLCLNFRSNCDFVHTMQEDVSEVINERCYA